MSPWRHEFFASDKGLRLLGLRRSMRRLRLAISGIEPRSKRSTTPEERVRIREIVRSQLRSRKRSAYRGSLVLQLDFDTTDKTPGHIQTLTKNFLDLLGMGGERGPGARPLLYRDDSQVCGLVVRCAHGQDSPMIRIEARSLGDFREDLALASRARDYGMLQDRTAGGRTRRALLPLDGGAPSSTPAEEALTRELRARDQQTLQRDTLGNHRIAVSDLARFYRVSPPDVRFDSEFLDDLAHQQENLFARSPLRILLSEAPLKTGQAGSYHDYVRNALHAWRANYSRLLDPLRIPVALEVIIKPQRSPAGGSVIDLDNLLRRYLIPGVIETFGPPADYHWAHRNIYGPAVAQTEIRGGAPKGAEIGLVRIEAWRIPRAPHDESPGFVALGLVADAFGFESTLAMTDSAADRCIDID